jgi:hypothetical protein
MKTFLIEDFFHLSLVSTTPLVLHLELNSKTFETSLMVLSGAWGTLIYVKT